MVRIQEATHLGDYKIRLSFDSGEEGVVDLADVVTGHPMAAPLLDPAEFARFALDEWPTLVWPCGFDLSPEMLYERATGKSPVWQVEAVHEARERYVKRKT